MEEDEHIEHVRHGELLEDEPVEGWAFAIAAEAEQELQAALGEALTIAGGPRAGSRKSSSAHSSTGGGTAYGSTAGGGPDNAAAAQPQHHHHAQSFGSVPEYAEVDVETEQQKYEARIKKGVQKDIKRMLMSTKAYVQYHVAPPSISKDKVKVLAKPKESLMHPDTLLAQQVGDPITYAELKAAKLGLARAAAEKRAAAEAEEEMHKANALRSFQAMKQQQKAEKAQREAAKAAEDAKYGKAVAGFVSERARAQLEEYRLKQEAQKQRAEALRQKIITGPFR